MTSSRSQRPAPAHYAGWGGTVVSSGNGPVTITSNGSVPEDSTVCIGRGQRYLGQGRLVNGNHIQAPGVAAQPGDWVSLVSVPRPPEQPASAYSSSSYYHSTSTNADPRYQQWLRQGFTLGRWSSRPYSSRNPYRTRY